MSSFRSQIAKYQGQEIPTDKGQLQILLARPHIVLAVGAACLFTVIIM